MKEVSIGKIVTLTGVFVSFYMGAAFASGQEIMQFFGPFGAAGIAGLLVVIAIYMFCCIQIQIMAQREQFDDPYQIFTYVMGRRLGTLYIWFMEILMLCNVVMMTASAGANVSENLGLPDIVGRLVVVFSAVTVCLGLNRITEILGRIGPFIALAMLVIAIISIVRAETSLAEGIRLSTQLDMYKGSSNWLVSIFKYGLYCNLTLFSSSVICGNRCSSRTEARAAATVETGVLGIVCIIMLIAQFMNISEIYDYQVPNMKLISMYLPRLAPFFSIVLLVCTFASSTVQMWTSVRKFQREKTPGYYIMTVCVAAVSLLVSGLIPFNVILNKLFVAGIVLGPVYFLAVFVKSFSLKRAEKRTDICCAQAETAEIKEVI